ncbi:taspase 1 [Leptinotarsa decemlineata]|uniref:taspase 1 n=1 Tax=Leptinotarsa decemlineata TaxID=7539 RepID=UPI003D3057A8
MTAIIAVHCGAGSHSSKLYGDYKRLCNRACRKGIQVLQEGGTAMEAVKAAVIVLENHPMTNSGFGSNLTSDGFVENDASVMDGRTLTFGGCGAVKKVKNPIALAYDICLKQSNTQPLGLVPPSLLVGQGGLQHARKASLKIVPNKRLISKKAFRQFTKYKKLLESHESHERLDTVGAVCIDSEGHVASACSSGGLILKKPGRVGQAALYASGTWADSLNKDTESTVAVCTTGCGEYLVQTQLAKEIADVIKPSSSPITDLHRAMTSQFLESRYLRNVKQKMAGALVLHRNSESGETSLLWGHSTETMGVSYMKLGDNKPKSIMSELPHSAEPGETINIGGAHFFSNNPSSKPLT